jgi:hypothetical protein
MTPPTTLPPPTPTLKTIPVESLSPAGAFVSVFTPTVPSGFPTTEEVDVNGITVGAWSSPLKSSAAGEWKKPYFWMVACCPCVPVAQFEVRLGLSSYARALVHHGFAYSVFVAFFLANVITILRLFGGAKAFWLEVFLLVCLVATALLVSRRLGQLRTEVRTRFSIEGTEKDDQYVACMHSSRAIRQLGRHLQCDRAVFTRAPTTLQAYQV